MGAPAALGFSLVGGAMSLMSGFSQQTAAQATAKEYMVQARLADLQAKTDEASRLDTLNRALGSNRASAGAMNIDVDSPSAVAIADANKAAIGRQIGLTRLSAEMGAQRDVMAASQATQAGSASVMSGLLRFGSSVFTGVAGYNKNVGPDAAILPGVFS